MLLLFPMHKKENGLQGASNTVETFDYSNCLFKHVVVSGCGFFFDFRTILSSFSKEIICFFNSLALIEKIFERSNLFINVCFDFAEDIEQNASPRNFDDDGKRQVKAKENSTTVSNGGCKSEKFQQCGKTESENLKSADNSSKRRAKTTDALTMALNCECKSKMLQRWSLTAGEVPRFADNSSLMAGEMPRFADNSILTAGETLRFADNSNLTAGEVPRFADNGNLTAGETPRFADNDNLMAGEAQRCFCNSLIMNIYINQKK